VRDRLRRTWATAAPVARPIVLRTGFVVAVFLAIVIAVTCVLRVVHLDTTFPSPVLEAAAPLTLLAAYPLLLASIWRRQRILGPIALVGIALHLWWFAGMLPVFHSDRSLAPDEVRVRIVTANLLFSNSRTPQIADEISKLAPDLIAFEEFTNTSGLPLTTMPQFAAYPYRKLATTYNPDGIALFSKLPIEQANTIVLGGRRAIEATVLTDAGPITVLAIHTVAPVNRGANRAWLRELDAIGDQAHAVSGPLVVVGDFNATPGNRPFVELTHRAKVHDVLNATGDGYATTWPANRRFTPTYTRPDHVLVGRGIRALGGHVVDNPGSDHRAIVVDVGVSRNR
jgi:endonuclease/exonuclease/phosphatase (EEP) superfamily protein YafD